MPALNTNQNKFQTQHSESGIGLMEVMLTLFILSVGFLAAANMQLLGMRSNQNAFFQSQANMMLSEMMDRMRNNREGVDNGYYSNVTTSTRTKPTCFDDGCDAEGVAAADLFEWSANLISLRGEENFIPMLPVDHENKPAVGTISNPDADGVFTLRMTWKHSDGDSVKTENVEIKFVP